MRESSIFYRIFKTINNFQKTLCENFSEWFFNCDCKSHCGFTPHCGLPPHCGYPPHCGCPPYPENCFVLIVVLVYSIFDWILSPFRRKKKDEVIIISSSQKPKVAFISVFDTPCGIATYNSDLLNELRHYADVKVFAEYDKDNNDPSWVVRCWSRNEHPKKTLLREIEKFNPDIVHFSHEYGFFMRAYHFTSLVSALKTRGYPVVATMHSIYSHMDKVVQEACPDHVISHTLSGKACLEKKGIESQKITVIPHGSNIFQGSSDSPELLPKLWNTWNSNYTLYQPGFLFGYKGHMRMLDIVARLKAEYPDVHYIVQGSENPNTMREHDELYAALVERCRELEIEENVTLNRGFVSRDVLLAHIRTVTCCVLPYANHPDHDVRATSGVGRMIIATETPLVVSKVHLFDDLTGLVPRAGDDDELFQEIHHIFSSEDYRQKLLEKRKSFLRKTSWPEVAHRTAALYDDVIARF